MASWLSTRRTTKTGSDYVVTGRHEHLPTMRAIVTIDVQSHASSTASRRATLPIFAYLRALSEGVSKFDAAQRYFGVDTPKEALEAHRQAVAEARTAARRLGDPAWRLLGMEFGTARQRKPTGALRAPSLEQWAEEEGLEDWSERELVALYVQRFPSEKRVKNGEPPDHVHRLRSRDARLRERRLALLLQLERVARSPATATDRIDGWFDETTSQRIAGAGAVTLADVQNWTAQGKRWWTDIPGLGLIKSRAIAASVTRLIGNPEWAIDWPKASVSGAHDGRTGANRQFSERSLIDAQDDRAAIAAWVDARAGSKPTRLAYTREAERFLLWCVIERGRALSDASVEDCRAYMAFLADVPPRWIRRRRSTPHTAGWAPFAGKLSVASRRQAVGVVASLFTWLTTAKYLRSDPWTLVSKKVNEDRTSVRVSPTSKAFTPAAWQALMDGLQPPGPSNKTERNPMARERLKWLCTVCEATGLRAAELLTRERGDIRMTPSGALLSVIGKGSKHREVPLPKTALEATRTYFALRRLDFDTAPTPVPLLASLTQPWKGLTYDSLYETFTRFVRRALKASALSEEERRAAMKASLHWLRHTHATRFAERGGDLDVLQANLGHSDPRTSARYFRAQIERRQAQVEKAFAK